MFRSNVLYLLVAALALTSSGVKADGCCQVTGSLDCPDGYVSMGDINSNALCSPDGSCDSITTTSTGSNLPECSSDSGSDTTGDTTGDSSASSTRGMTNVVFILFATLALTFSGVQGESDDCCIVVGSSECPANYTNAGYDGGNALCSEDGDCGDTAGWDWAASLPICGSVDTTTDTTEDTTEDSSASSTRGMTNVIFLLFATLALTFMGEVNADCCKTSGSCPDGKSFVGTTGGGNTVCSSDGTCGNIDDSLPDCEGGSSGGGEAEPVTTSNVEESETTTITTEDSGAATLGMTTGLALGAAAVWL